MQRYNNTVISPTGQAIAGASIAVTVAANPPGTGAAAQLFGDDGITPISNIVVADSLGRFGFFAPDGKYDLTVSGGTPTVSVPYTLAAVEIIDMLEFNPLDSQPIAAQTLNLTEIPAGTLPPSGTINVYSKQIDNRLYYQDPTGTEIGPLVGPQGGGVPGGLVGDVQKNSGTGVFQPSSINDNGTLVSIKEDTSFQGPNPWIDVRNFGVRSLSVAPQTTGTINAGSNSLVVASANGFQVGDGLVIYGAGATNVMATPAGPTVASAVASGGTSTGCVVAGPAGSNTNQYQVAAWELGGGLSAASPVVVTNTAQTLGRQTATISNIVLVNNVVTVTTSAPHTLVVGAEVFVVGTGNDFVYAGFYSVSTAPDNTHFTYLSQFDTRNGADGTAKAQGTVNYFNCNQIVATPTTGNFIYVVYGRSSGSMAPIGIMYPQNANLTGQDSTHLTFTDFGSPFTTPPTLPAYIPTVPPAVATNDNLVTTITNISGSTFTLAATATNSVTAATVKFDNTPNAQAAMVAANSTNPKTAIYFPVPPPGGGQYIFNSLWNIGTGRVVQAGQVVLRDIVVANSLDWRGTTTNSPCSGTPQFSTACYPAVSIQSPLGFYITNSGNFSNVFLNGQSPNANTLLLQDGGIAGLYTNVQFVASVSVTDTLSKCVVKRGNSNGVISSFGDFFENCLFFDIGNNADGFDFTPAYYGSYAGTIVRFNHTWISRRGIFLRPPTYGGNVGIDWIYSQGNSNPLFTAYKDQSNGGIYMNMKNIQFDTSASPGVTSLGSAGGTSTEAITLTINTSNTPAPTMPFITGPNIFFDGHSIAGAITAGLTTALPSQTVGQFAVDGIINTSPGSYTIQRVGTATALGAAYPFFTENIPASAPTVTVQAGGAIPIGTHSLTIHPMFPNGTAAGAEGRASTPVSFTTFAGNQQIQVSNFAVAGATGYNMYVDNVLSNLPLPMPQVTSTAPFTYGSSFGHGETEPRIPAGGPVTIQGSTVAAINVRAGQILYNGVAFANLGTPADGTVVYCPDCAITSPCVGAGTGALAKRLGGVWVCN